MPDKNRKTVDILVIHHSCGPDLKNKSDITVQDWYDKRGRELGYTKYCKSLNIDVNNYDTGHSHPRRTKCTFSQAQYALYEHKNKFRLIELMVNPFECTAWGVDRGGKIDSRAINIEVCGDYHYKMLPVEAFECIVARFIYHARNLQKIGKEFRIGGHCDFGQTECPGAIYGQLDTLRDMFMDKLKKTEIDE